VIIKVGTNIKTPSLTVYLDPKFAQELVSTTVSAAIVIRYDPDRSSAIIEEHSVSSSLSSPFPMKKSSPASSTVLGSFGWSLFECNSGVDFKRTSSNSSLAVRKCSHHLHLGKICKCSGAKSLLVCHSNSFLLKLLT
jgi:hypothetical protein